MAGNFNDPFAANLIGLWDFLDGAKTKDTGLADGVAQDGHVHGNASISGGKLNLNWDGCNGGVFDVAGDGAVPGNDAPFDLAVGTVAVQFTQDCHVGTSPDTLVNRGEYADRATEGFFEIRVTKDGRVEVMHCANGSEVILKTDPGFFCPGDVVKATYSWSETEGGSFKVENLTAATETVIDYTTTGLTMDIGDNDDESWSFGARETDDGSYGRYFDGSIDYVAIYDKDIINPGPSDGIVSGTASADLIDVAYTGDPDGDMIDAGDAVLAGEGPDDDIVDAGSGNDTVLAGLGDDDVYAGGGDDHVEGGMGDDLIYGDGSLGTVPADYFEERSQDISNVVFYFDRDDDGVYDYAVKVDEFPDGSDSSFISNDLDDYFGQLRDFVVAEIPDLSGAAVVTGVSVKGGTQPTLFYAVAGNGNGPAPDDGPTINTGPEPDAVLLYEDFYAVYDPALGSGSDPDIGVPGNDTLEGGIGDDTLYGEEGDDHLLGGDGSDVAIGGSGDDLIDTGNGEIRPDKGYPGLFPADSDPENDRDFVDGGTGNDTIRTGDDRDTITGGDGADIIDGGIDDDEITGDDGADRIVGGEGNDLIAGGTGNDTIYAGNDPVLGLDALDIEDDGSNPFGPDLRPDNGRDTVSGGEGNDVIFGADDDDVLSGDSGDDFIDGQIDDDLISGGTGTDTLLGGQGDDAIDGGADDDLIDGGIGSDSLFGGDDRDTFVNVNAGDTVDGGAGGNDCDVLDLTGSAPSGGSLQVTFTGPDSNGNGQDGFVTYYDEFGIDAGRLDFTEIEEVIPCFTPGTLIATPEGERAVETLEVGDKVITRDNGIQEIRWVGNRGLTGAELARNSHLCPVKISKGALGDGLPERDMYVSPNHRILVANDKTALYFDESEVLVAAKHLTGLPGIDVVDARWVTYIHLMFDQHEVILSDGAWTESFQPGDGSLKGIGNAQRNELFELFPELKSRVGIDNYVAARRSLKRYEAVLLTE